jgi:hypothetical protein
MSVRNSSGGVVQFTYGDDGLDPTHLEGDIEPVDFKRTWRHTVVKNRDFKLLKQLILTHCIRRAWRREI